MGVSYVPDDTSSDDSLYDNMMRSWYIVALLISSVLYMKTLLGVVFHDIYLNF